MDRTEIAAYEPWLSRPHEAVIADLESYSALLHKWQVVQNLVSRETLATLWQRHFADSLQILKYLDEANLQFLDLGSGGGFPALPLAIASVGTGRHFTLIEPNARKVSFLRTVSRELGLPVTVIGSRSDEIDSRETLADVITSRALAGLPMLCGWMEPFFGRETRALLHKGREHVEEVAESRAQWHFDVLTHRSDTDPGGVILEITNLRGTSMR